MICILKIGPGTDVQLQHGLRGVVDQLVEGWIIATDLPDARRQAETAGQNDLASILYCIEFTPAQGRHWLPTKTGHLMLVS